MIIGLNSIRKIIIFLLSCKADFNGADAEEIEFKLNMHWTDDFEYFALEFIELLCKNAFINGKFTYDKGDLRFFQASYIENCCCILEIISGGIFSLKTESRSECIASSLVSELHSL